ncbi:hypothetical protein [Nocardia abscessus]|uniref:hypothetical protein n=1 Tax=Nocardia abscessus TaxID=120957 RepID=UPI0024551F9D|nr:hypothetical protein [Nocardia abscessus]
MSGEDVGKATPPFGLPLELLEYVRERYRLGRRVGRAEPMEKFGASREQIDKARVLVELEMGAGSAEARAELVNKILADDAVYRLIETDIKSSRERRIRGRARVTHAELRAAEKALVAEHRDLRNAKSPFEVGIKATLELNRAAQYVHAVGKTMEDMHPVSAEEIINALKDLGEQVALVLAECTDAVQIERSVVINAEEARQEQSGRAAG